jgi:hypothetical protein
MLVCAFLVFFMQAGFALLEAGTVRCKNVRNIIMKNGEAAFGQGAWEGRAAAHRPPPRASTRPSRRRRSDRRRCEHDELVGGGLRLWLRPLRRERLHRWVLQTRCLSLPRHPMAQLRWGLGCPGAGEHVVYQLRSGQKPTQNCLRLCLLARRGRHALSRASAPAAGSLHASLPGYHGFFSSNADENSQPAYWAFWLFGWAFSATASTVVSGSMAERTKFRWGSVPLAAARPPQPARCRVLGPQRWGPACGSCAALPVALCRVTSAELHVYCHVYRRAYLIYTCCISAFIYPVVVHWVWSGSGEHSLSGPEGCSCWATSEAWSSGLGGEQAATHVCPPPPQAGCRRIAAPTAPPPSSSLSSPAPWGSWTLLAAAWCTWWGAARRWWGPGSWGPAWGASPRYAAGWHAAATIATRD